MGEGTEDAAEADMSIAAIEGYADIWAARIDLNGMVENMVCPMRLNRNVPDDVRADFTKRMKDQIDAMIRQAFIEGAVLALDGFSAESLNEISGGRDRD